MALVPLGIEDVPETAGAFARVRGATLLAHTVRGLTRSGCVDRVVVAGPHETHVACAAALDAVDDHRVDLVPGGRDHQESTRRAVHAATESGDIVLVHDPTRAFTPPETVRAVVEAVRDGAVAAVPVEPVTDTVKVVDTTGDVRCTSDRDLLRRAQSPRGFTADFLRHADIADALALVNLDVRTVPGHPHGMRVSTAFERTVAEAVFSDLVGEEQT
ncbi:2-C-methyl-D-erythritol 4-phosphate cytidylyltransferase [Saccharomonospora sp.]|uniref:IspD/TarI family cytidylyltransferase n=1 Tax=Saccharomonospora sp. TaxID=33913 RepID=UPI00343B86A5